MHSIIKNLSKVLALTILSTSFQPNFVSAGNTRRNSKAQHTEAKSAAETSDYEQLLNQEIERFTKLGHGLFIFDPAFKQQGNYQATYLMLKQLNDLFEKYPNVLKKFIEYCVATKEPFVLKRLKPTFAVRKAPANPLMGEPQLFTGIRLSAIDGYLHYMSLCIPKCTPTFFDDLSSCFTEGFTARVDADKYLQSVVSHEFGHLMSFLKCITDYCNSIDSPGVQLLGSEEMTAIYDAHSQEIRDAIARKCGHAPYISHYANRTYSLGCATLPSSLKPGAELTLHAHEKVDKDYFAELFAYAHCNSKAPDELKTALHEIIDTWFVDDTSFLAIPYDQLLERLAPLTLIK